jgi:hypothetical protein
MALTIDGVSIPDSKLAREVTELVRDTESALLFHHSSRVYYFGALAGQHRGLTFDRELLYTGAMFHDMGLTRQHSASMSASRWTARTPPAISSVATAFLDRKSTLSGRQSRFTPRPAFRSTCTLSSPW